MTKDELLNKAHYIILEAVRQGMQQSSDEHLGSTNIQYAAIDDLTEKFAELVQPQWNLCKDGLPRKETDVLVLVNGEINIGAIFTEIPSHEDTYIEFDYWDNPRDDGQDWEWDDVTHWQSMPDAPAVSK